MAVLPMEYGIAFLTSIVCLELNNEHQRLLDWVGKYITGLVKFWSSSPTGQVKRLTVIKSLGCQLACRIPLGPVARREVMCV